MFTYGLSETIKEHPSDHYLKELKRKIAELQDERDVLVSACAHHFIPQKGSLEKLGLTNAPDVYSAGTIGEISGTSDKTFSLECTKCGLLEKTPLSSRCPTCAEVTKGEWGDMDDIGKYLKGSDFIYYCLWIISCTRCDFMAAGLRWDQ